jgi:hypothetical protein
LGARILAKYGLPYEGTNVGVAQGVLDDIVPKAID